MAARYTVDGESTDVDAENTRIDTLGETVNTPVTPFTHRSALCQESSTHNRPNRFNSYMLDFQSHRNSLESMVPSEVGACAYGAKRT